MDYYEHAYAATARLSWAYPGQTHAGRAAVGVVSLLRPSISLRPCNAGTDQTISQSGAASLNGAAVDDGLPTPRRDDDLEQGQRARGCRRRAGRVRQSNAPITTATFSAAGTYVLRLTVSDGAVTVSDDVTITVDPAGIGTGNGLLGEYFNDPE